MYSKIKKQNYPLWEQRLHIRPVKQLLLGWLVPTPVLLPVLRTLHGHLLAP